MHWENLALQKMGYVVCSQSKVFKNIMELDQKFLLLPLQSLNLSNVLRVQGYLPYFWQCRWSMSKQVFKYATRSIIRGGVTRQSAIRCKSRMYIK